MVPQFAASVGKVGPVTLKKSPIDILAPTIAAMNSLVAHLGLNIYLTVVIPGIFKSQNFSKIWVKILENLREKMTQIVT